MKKPISSRIRHILKTHYPLQRDKKFKQIAIRVRDFLGFWAEDSNLRLEYSISITGISSLVESYFYDIIRFKEYHMSLTELSTEKEQIEIVYNQSQAADWLDTLHDDENGKKINNSKIATLTAKWFLKTLPICITQTEFNIELTSEERLIAIYCNEIFLFLHICDLLEISWENISEIDTYDLIYSFKYRLFDEAAFHIIFKNLEQKYQKGKIVNEAS